MKKVLLYIAMGIALLLFIAFFIWANVTDREWTILAFLGSVFGLFLVYGLISTMIDKKKRRKEEQRPPDFTDEKLGEFWCDSAGMLTRRIKWCNDDITLYIKGSNEEEIKDSAKHAYLHFQNPIKSDRIIREYATDELISTANDWNEDGIDREEFINRISLCLISVNSNGDYEFWFNDDEIFREHSIVVYGNAISGFERADIEG